MDDEDRGRVTANLAWGVLGGWTIPARDPSEFQLRIGAMGHDQRRPYDIVRRKIRRNQQRAADLP
jgi:hypothetical protein